MDTNNDLIIIEQIMNAPVATAWSALVDNDRMKNWYFELAEFRPETGFEFRFSAGSEEKKYLHICKITEVLPLRKLAYSWRFDGDPGYSVVSFELSAQEEKTKVTLTHEGVETFDQTDPAMARENFKGWEAIIGTNLKNYVEQQV